MEKSEEWLARGMSEQDPAALEAVMDLYASNIYGLVYRILQGAVSREDIEECVSDVFAAAWNRTAEYEPRRGTGFPIKVSRVERIPKEEKIDGEGEAGEDSIRICFELHGDEQAAETLYEFPPSPLNGGAVWHRNEQTNRLEWMLLSVQPGQKEYELKVSSLNSQVRGPWEFWVDQP